MKVFSSQETKILESMAWSFFPSDNPLRINAKEAEVVGFLENYFSRFPLLIRWFLKIFLHFFNLASGLMIFSFHTFCGLRDEKKNQLLERLRLSRWYLFRLLFQGIKLMFSMAFFAHPEVLKRIGFYEVCPPKPNGR